MILRWLPILAPAILALVIAILFNQSELPNPTLFVRFQVSVLIFFFGVGLSLIATIMLLISDWIERRHVATLLQASEERRHFLRRLDHELKNPLTAILAGLANLSSSDTSDQRDVAMRSVETQMRRLRNLVSDLRKLADLERRSIEFNPIDMNPILVEAYEYIGDKEEAQSRNFSISIPQAPWPLPYVSGDRDLLFLVVHNLLDNALKFTQPGDTIELRAYEAGSNLTVEVADTGIGIRESERAFIWDELYRGEDARGIPGSGLGLALVKSIIQRHNGHVDVRSRSGQGTVFSFSLPVLEVTKR
ncbi:MAG: HAMP domain-containing sensor histidine kinase [Anaerolineales bacterium]|jgi:two-component system OmpR family sensor kinase